MIVEVFQLRSINSDDKFHNIPFFRVESLMYSTYIYTFINSGGFSTNIHFCYIFYHEQSQFIVHYLRYKKENLVDVLDVLNVYTCINSAGICTNRRFC